MFEADVCTENAKFMNMALSNRFLGFGHHSLSVPAETAQLHAGAPGRPAGFGHSRQKRLHLRDSGHTVGLAASYGARPGGYWSEVISAEVMTGG